MADPSAPFYSGATRKVEKQTKLIAEMKWCEAYSWVEVH
jgi:hypothetical protein